MYSTEILLNTTTIREVNSTEIHSNFTARETQDYAPDVTKTGNGEWGMGNGEWGMGNGEWGMGNGEWEIENGKFIFFTLTFYNVE